MAPPTATVKIITSTTTIETPPSAFKKFIEKKGWRFYLTASVAGIALAGISALVIANSYPRRKQRKSNKLADQECFSVLTTEAYESMTDTIISVMSAEQRLAAANQLKVAGSNAFTSKKYQEAIGLYTQAIRFKADPAYYSNRAACFSNLGQNEQVLADCNMALSLNPMYTNALKRRAQALERKGDLSNALFDYTALCILDRFKNKDAAKSMNALSKRISELKAKEMIKTKAPRLPSPTFVTAYLESFRMVEEAVSIPITADQETGDFYYAKARRALAEKKYYEALDKVQKAVSLGCSENYQPKALNLKGTLMFLEGNADSALDCFNRSLQLDPSYVQNYIKRSSIYMEKGDISIALNQFEDAILLNPSDPDIYYHRGQVNYITGQYEAAIKDYTESIRLDPTFLYSYIQLAIVQYRLGMSSDSVITFRETINKFPLSSDAYNYFGELLADQKGFPEAAEMFDKAMSLNPSNPLPYINKAMLAYQNMNKVEEAINLCKSALEADPACDAAVASLAQMYLEQSRPAEALPFYEKAIDLARTETELEQAISYVEATKSQIRFAKEYPDAASKLATLKQ